MKPAQMKFAQQSDDRRWSELVPPRTALTFAAVWDPVEGMITFSGAHLLESDSVDCVTVKLVRSDLPRDALDNQSQALTIDMLTHVAHLTKGRQGKFPCSWTCEAHTDTDTTMGSQFLPGWLAVPTRTNTGPNSPAFASSVALTALFESEAPDGDDVHWVGGIPLRCIPIRFEPSKSDDDESVTDEGFFEGRQLPTGSYASLPVFVDLQFHSAFSVTTTSTTNYVAVDFPEELTGYAFLDDMESWETVRGVDRSFCMNSPPFERKRRLRKIRVIGPRPTSTRPASPEEVLSREQYNHMHPAGTPPSPSIKRKGSIARARELLDKLGKCVKNEDDDGWVCVEVTQKVTHKVAHNIL
ncbi:hypothetical protein WOLCODRAFT_105397 [Wolfiporia cocos MD-104 SS10]|uniref:Uncharacterized protein n=1 Tax=Wolfiporia cocos (strain MD-104) TaxID=742152 RepID=A0A2H3JRR4_WOLCO|nr:hypothetical protein WOLCODRAFT_105397 [Wolfiporia cocos MD-104 SS10]